MTKTILTVLAVLSIGVAGVMLVGSRGGVVAGDEATLRADMPRHDSPPSASGNLVVELCDGQTAAEIPGVKEGETPTREQAQAVVDQLMTEWRRKNPNASWDAEPMRVAQAGVPQAGTAPRQNAVQPPVPQSGAGAGAPAAAAQAGAGVTSREKAAASGATTGGAGGLPSGPQGDMQSGHTYGAFSERDERIWKEETDKFVKEGHKIFHDANAFGGTIGVSCDMCHPDGANTHPETYPKFQVQLGRVALLRDMINWCIQNPTRGKPLLDDDPRLKAMEAYILAQRKGTPLDFGKH
jgi:thiosulfate dehydrogenase